MVLVDSTIWSLALRRRREHLNADESAKTHELERLIAAGAAGLIGPVRQEVLSGIREASAFEAIQGILAAFEDLTVLSKDYVAAAGFFNTCRARGISGTPVDMLICAVAARTNLSIFTTDHDFDAYSKHLPIKLHQ